MALRSKVTTFLARGASRKPLTPKKGNKNFYKGTGTGPTGAFMPNSTTYRIDPTKVRQFVVPDLTGFALKPYVSWAVPQEKFEWTTSDYIGTQADAAANRIPADSSAAASSTSTTSSSA
ncbi:mitochondrial ribosomal protein L27-domain-containing protein [Blastocladiella britannica]|nr:mitochondrial ribosomal protein L27-domain-containing protein [Blastocladiella britannica]